MLIPDLLLSCSDIVYLIPSCYRIGKHEVPFKEFPMKALTILCLIASIVTLGVAVVLKVTDNIYHGISPRSAWELSIWFIGFGILVATMRKKHD